jgi:hypothetical protein
MIPFGLMAQDSSYTLIVGGHTKIMGNLTIDSVFHPFRFAVSTLGTPVPMQFESDGDSLYWTNAAGERFALAISQDSTSVHKVRTTGTGLSATQVGDTVVLRLMKYEIDTLKSQIVFKGGSFNGMLSLGTQTGAHSWSFPDSSGILATQQYVNLYGGSMTRQQIVDSIKLSPSTLEVATFSAGSTSLGTGTILVFNDQGDKATLAWGGSMDASISLPLTSGMIALREDSTSIFATHEYVRTHAQSSYADSAGALTWGSKTIHGNLTATSDIAASGNITTLFGNVTGQIVTGMAGFLSGSQFTISPYSGENAVTLNVASQSAPHTFTLPDKTGTIAMLSDLVTANYYQWQIDTVGTVKAGTWHGGTIALAYGGTNNATYNVGQFISYDDYSQQLVSSGYSGSSFALPGGSNASGTWGISISGNASTATYANSAGSAGVAAGVPWSGVADKPSDFAPSTHNNSAHSEAYVTASGSVAYASNAGAATDAHYAVHADNADNATQAGEVPWSGVSAKPSTFTPSTHGNEAHSATYITSAALSGYATETWVTNQGYKNGAWLQDWKENVLDADYPSVTGSGASGTWGISVTGSAGSVTWGNVSGKPYSSFGTMSQENVGVSGSFDASGTVVTVTNGIITGIAY